MGEIKSTLDLVMEKTKHLSLSDEEKQNQKQIEVKKRINGLLQKYRDQVLSMEQLYTEYDRLKKELNLPDDTGLVNQIIDKIDLAADNRPLMALLNNLCESGTEGIEALLGEFQEELNSAASYRMLELREGLAQKHSIFGSAVVPNLQADDTWLEEADVLRTRFAEKLGAEKDKLQN